MMAETVAYMMVNPYLPGSEKLLWNEPDWHISWAAVPLCLKSDLEAAERERDEARDSVALVAAERDALLADWNAVQDATLDDLCGLLVGVVVDRRDLRAERDALAALLARVVDQYGDDYRLTQRLMAEIGDALAAKEQSK